MDLIKGVNSYVTLAEANTYVLSYYISTDPFRINWELLSDDDKTILLNRAMSTIERQPFTGTKTRLDQVLAFPRFPLETVPREIQNAQIEEAIALGDPSTAAEQQRYTAMYNWGVSSYSIGNLSESLSTGGWGIGALASSTATSFLTPFLQGGYRINAPSAW